MELKNNFNMHHDNTYPITSTIFMTILAIASGIFGFLEHVDLVMGIMAKLTGILAGTVSIIIAYRTYVLHKKK